MKCSLTRYADMNCKVIYSKVWALSLFDEKGSHDILKDSEADVVGFLLFINIHTPIYSESE